MGLLINGKWHDQWYDTKSSGGRFIREDSQFRNKIGEDSFPAEVGRYHLYVSHACPWAHRTMIFRVIKNLEDIISVSVVEPKMLEHGWTFAKGADALYHKNYLYEIYTHAEPTYSGRVTVPVLWDKKQHRIVNNESAEIIRMFNESFNALTNNNTDYYPKELRLEIDEINDEIYHKINNGVYKVGFATSQEIYTQEVSALFTALGNLDKRLGANRYLLGNRITEADWRLFTTLLRFDAVYVGHFKCNMYRIADYQNLSGYLRELYQVRGVQETVHMDVIKAHYYGSHDKINPTGIIPDGPILDFSSPHEREGIS